MVNILKELFRTSGIGIGQGAAPGNCLNTYVMQFSKSEDGPIIIMMYELLADSNLSIQIIM